jgi:predicted nucleotidyltransferase
VARLELPGPAETDAYDADRFDLDFIVAHPPGYDFGPWLSRFQVLEDALSDELGPDVDLVVTSALRNRWFARGAAAMQTVIYDASDVSGSARRRGLIVPVHH